MKNKNSHVQLFGVVNGLSRTRPQPFPQELDNSTIKTLSAFGRKSELRAMFAVHSGRNMARKCGAAVSELAGRVGLRLNEPWRQQWDEITGVLARFFREGGDNPAVLWSHTLCWTDRAIRRRFLGSELGGEDRQYRPIVRDRRLRLFFHGQRRATLRSWLLQWLPPDPYVPCGEERLTKIVETCVTRQKDRPISYGHREAIGACAGRPDDDIWLARSLFPGLRQQIYSLVEDRDGDFVGRKVDQSTGSEVGSPHVDGRLVDDRGILDVQIIKGWRLWMSPCLHRARTVTLDELAFVFDRSGQVAYVAATWDKLSSYVPEVGEDNWLEDWLLRNS